MKDMLKLLIPHQRWTLFVWLYMAVALLYVNTLGVTEKDNGFRGPTEVYDTQLWGWPLLFYREDNGYPTYFALYHVFLNSVACTLTLACSGYFLERYVHRWIKYRQWTLGDLLLMVTAACPFLSLVLLIWSEIHFVRNLRDLPAFVMLPVVFGIYCVVHATCGLGYYFLGSGLRLGGHAEKDAGAKEGDCSQL
jgi:hypothetical protein